MSAIIIDGKQVAADIRAEVAQKVAALKKNGKNACLAVILVGENPASVSYVTGKQKALVFQRSHLVEELPVFQPLQRPCRCNQKYLCTQLRHPPELFRETQIIAGGQTDFSKFCFHLSNTGTGAENPFFF